MSGLIGNFAANPRVFGHDAKAVTIGAVNDLWPGDMNGTGIGGYIIKKAGKQYVVGDTADQVSVTDGGAGFEAKVAEVDANGGIVRLDIVKTGNGYNATSTNSVITLTTPSESSSTAAMRAEIEIINIDIRGTDTRGVVLYNGKSTAQDITIITETDENVQFKQVQPGDVVGSKVPVLVKRLVTGTDCVAIY